MSALTGALALVKSLTVLKLTLRYPFFLPERWLIYYRSTFYTASID